MPVECLDNMLLILVLAWIKIFLRQRSLVEAVSEAIEQRNSFKDGLCLSLISMRYFLLAHISLFSIVMWMLISTKLTIKVNMM